MYSQQETLVGFNNDDGNTGFSVKYFDSTLPTTNLPCENLVPAVMVINEKKFTFCDSKAEPWRTYIYTVGTQTLVIGDSSGGKFIDVGSVEILANKKMENKITCNLGDTPWIQVITPNGAEVFRVGEKITVKWESCNVPLSSHEIFVALHQNGEWQNVIYLSNATVDDFGLNDKNETFTIPIIAPVSYKIRVGEISPKVKQDFSDNVFTIHAP